MALRNLSEVRVRPGHQRTACEHVRVANHVSQILHAMTSAKAMWLDPSTGQWRWRISHLSRQSLGGSARELLLQRIADAQDEVRKLLYTATLLDDEFDTETLAVVSGLEPATVREIAEKAVDLGLLSHADTPKADLI